MEQNFNPGLAIIGLSGTGPWTSRFCFVFFFYSNWFSEYKHPFIDKPMFVTKPDVHVPSAQLSRYPSKRAAHAQ